MQLDLATLPRGIVGGKLSLNGTRVLKESLEAKTRIVVNQGGSRSSKTTSLCQLFLMRLQEQTGDVFSIVRKSLPALKGSVMRDFFDMLKFHNLYHEEDHNKTENIYRYGNMEVEFFSVDEPQKIRGRKRKLLWLNEANELTYEDFIQLALRTTSQIYLDYNPSDEVHWIYEKILTRPDCTFIKSTYRDALKFLPPETIQEIERLKGEDETYWQIYGLGEPAASSALVYRRWKMVGEMPEGADLWYGLDFGFNNPSALVSIGEKDQELFVEEKLYETRLTNTDLIARLKEMELGSAEIFADCAEPQRIEEMVRAGFNVHESDKSVKDGIDSVKRHILNVVKPSSNLVRELRSYKNKLDKAGNIIDEPVKYLDHLMDAMRYAIHTRAMRGSFQVVFEL